MGCGERAAEKPSGSIGLETATWAQPGCKRSSPIWMLARGPGSPGRLNGSPPPSRACLRMLPHACLLEGHWGEHGGHLSGSEEGPLEEAGRERRSKAYSSLRLYLPCSDATHGLPGPQKGAWTPLPPPGGPPLLCFLAGWVKEATLLCAGLAIQSRQPERAGAKTNLVLFSLLLALLHRIGLTEVLCRLSIQTWNWESWLLSLAFGFHISKKADF